MRGAYLIHILLGMLSLGARSGCQADIRYDPYRRNAIAERMDLPEKLDDGTTCSFQENITPEHYRSYISCLIAQGKTEDGLMRYEVFSIPVHEGDCEEPDCVDQVRIAMEKLQVK